MWHIQSCPILVSRGPQSLIWEEQRMAISISVRKIISIYKPLILCWIIKFRMKVKTTFPIIIKFGITNFAGSVPRSPCWYCGAEFRNRAGSHSYMPSMSHNRIHPPTTDGRQCRSEVSNLIRPASIFEYFNSLILGRWGSPDAWCVMVSAIWIKSLPRIYVPTFVTR